MCIFFKDTSLIRLIENTDSSETTISAVWPGDHYDYEEGTYVPEVFNRGGIAYYKYEIPNTRIINDQLKIIVNECIRRSYVDNKWILLYNICRIL